MDFASMVGTSKENSTKVHNSETGEAQKQRVSRLDWIICEWTRAGLTTAGKSRRRK